MSENAHQLPSDIEALHALLVAGLTASIVRGMNLATRQCIDEPRRARERPGAAGRGGRGREALKEWTRERVPLQWATTQNNLGIALRILGERESGTARLYFTIG